MCEVSQPLRYMDFIESTDKMKPVIAEISKRVGLDIIVVQPPDFTISGPKEQQALATFSVGSADIGRI